MSGGNILGKEGRLGFKLFSKVKKIVYNFDCLSGALCHTFIFITIIVMYPL